MMQSGCLFIATVTLNYVLSSDSRKRVFNVLKHVFKLMSTSCTDFLMMRAQRPRWRF